VTGDWTEADAIREAKKWAEWDAFAPWVLRLVEERDALKVKRDEALAAMRSMMRDVERAGGDRAALNHAHETIDKLTDKLAAERAAHEAARARVTEAAEVANAYRNAPCMSALLGEPESCEEARCLSCAMRLIAFALASPIAGRVSGGEEG